MLASAQDAVETAPTGFPRAAAVDWVAVPLGRAGPGAVPRWRVVRASSAARRAALQVSLPAERQAMDQSATRVPQRVAPRPLGRVAVRAEAQSLARGAQGPVVQADRSKQGPRDLRVASRDLRVAQRDLQVAQRDLQVAQRDLRVAQRDLLRPRHLSRARIPPPLRPPTRAWRLRVARTERGKGCWMPVGFRRSLPALASGAALSTSSVRKRFAIRVGTYAEGTNQCSRTSRPT